MQTLIHQKGASPTGTSSLHEISTTIHTAEDGVRSRPSYLPSRRACVHPAKSPSFLLCAVIFSYILLREFYNVAVFSREHHDQIHDTNLREPWPIFAALGSRGLDFVDNQWRNFCGNFFTVSPFMAIVVALSRYIRGRDQRTNTATVTASCGPQSIGSKKVLTPLAWFHCIIGAIFVAYLHGPRFVFMVTLVLTNYFVIAPLSRQVPYRVWLAGVWVFHIGILLINDRYSGYRFGSIFGNGVRQLDKVSEVMPWNVLFNMSTLRMIAYCIDYEEAHHRGTPELKARLEDKHKATCLDCVSRRCACYKLRTDTPRPLPEYNLVHYFAYLFYVPLYIAGPMSSFNAYVSHLYVPQRWFGLKDAALYLGNIAALAATLFTMMHFSHIHAIGLHPTLFDTAPVGLKVSFFVQSLAFLWLKFSIFWKFFRLVALADGFDVPEDMVRCFCLVTTVANFWRDWHASFNIWIIRYMYIPMGGSRFKILAIFPIFGFIALWHDIEMKLFWWAAIMCVAFLPEAIGTAFFSQRKFAWIQNAPYYPYLRVIGSYVSIMSLIMGNLVGYGAGEKKTGSGASQVATDFLYDMDVVLFLSLPLFSSYLTWYMKDREYEAHRRLQWDCGLLDQEKDREKASSQKRQAL